MPRATLKVFAIFLTLQATLSKPAKNNARPVHEIINELSRIDEGRDKPLPYVNPLALTSNAKIYLAHQQAMFNAKKVRQHRALLQRWLKVPQTDSYMKAYQETQENHQLALEQMQSNFNKRAAEPNQGQKLLQTREAEEIQIPELTRITKADAILAPDKTRNHRSYGTIQIIPMEENKINITPDPVYDRGVSIKPNGYNGLNDIPVQTKTYPELVTNLRYIYPKTYGQMYGYRSAEDIKALNYLLSKPAQEQLTKFNALVNKNTEKLDKPVDIYFYSKDTTVNDGQLYTTPYNTEYNVDFKDEKPIIEEVDDIEDPNKYKSYGIHGVLSTPPDIETTTTQSTNYKTEMDQTINSYPEDEQTTQYAIIKDEPSFHAVAYKKPLVYYPKVERSKYLHHEETGIQHLSQDGTGVSAYGSDDIHYAANYEFGYRVRDHDSRNYFGHRERKSGERTQGQYHVLLPDGRMQQVSYSAGPSGFHADISYDHLQ